MKIMLTGANGQLGSEILEVLTRDGHEVIALTHDDLELSDLFRIKELIIEHLPQVLINTAAFHNVNECEQNPQKAFRINAEAPGFMARMCNYLHIKFIHFSTDYVFSGKLNRPYNESDSPDPLNVYGLSKLKGENLIRSSSCKQLIIRISGIYGKNPCRAKKGLNFVKLMLDKASKGETIQVVDDQIVAPTPVSEIAATLPELIHKDVHGLLHISTSGECSWYDYAREIFAYAGIEANLIPGKSSDSTIKRPAYSVLDNRLMMSKGFGKMPSWKDALHKYLDEIKEPAY